MKLLFLLSATLTTVSLCIAEEPPVARETSPDEVVSEIVDAANHLLQTLSEEQRQAILFEFDDDQQRQNWSNLPVPHVPRGGLKMGDLSDEQRTTVMQMMGATLSERGLQQVIDNMNGDQLLVRGDNRMQFGKDFFFVSILGEPSTTEPWMWQFGGHHLGLNATICQDQVTLSPSLTGGQPVDYELDGRKVRQLGGDEDAAFALVNALTEDQRQVAIVSPSHVDLNFGPGTNDITPKPEGIAGSALTVDQKELFVALIWERIGIINDTHCKTAMKRIEATFDDTYFAWFGGTDPESPMAYRVQGPNVIIEYSPQRLGGDLTQHTHAMYRDPTNDYGVKFVEMSVP